MIIFVYRNISKIRLKVMQKKKKNNIKEHCIIDSTSSIFNVYKPLITGIQLVNLMHESLDKKHCFFFFNFFNKTYLFLIKFRLVLQVKIEVRGVFSLPPSWACTYKTEPNMREEKEPLNKLYLFYRLVGLQILQN